MKTNGVLFASLVLLAGCAKQQSNVETPAESAAMPSKIVAVYVAQEIPTDPNASVWRTAQKVRVPLSPQIIVPPRGGGSVTELLVSAVHDGQQLAMRFEWVDTTPDREVGLDRFRDAVAVGFPTRESESLPSPFMGDPEHPINIWQWTADFDANARGQGAFAEKYPHTEGVWYFPQDYAATREVVAWRGFEPVIELTATGFGTLERKVAQGVLGLGEYANGRWTVILRRELSTGNPEDSMFRPSEMTHVIFAVWDGAQKEVNGMKGVTMTWIPFVLQPTVVASRQR